VLAERELKSRPGCVLRAFSIPEPEAPSRLRARHSAVFSRQDPKAQRMEGLIPLAVSAAVREMPRLLAQLISGTRNADGGGWDRCSAPCDRVQSALHISGRIIRVSLPFVKSLSR
jgi:hypothetical protein